MPIPDPNFSRQIRAALDFVPASDSEESHTAPRDASPVASRTASRIAPSVAPLIASRLFSRCASSFQSPATPPVARRNFLQLLFAAAASCGYPAAAFAVPKITGHGAIKPPLPVPDVKLVTHDGASTTLFNLVNHHATAVQLMFTSCTTTCPIQAAIFARVQNRLPEMSANAAQLLSLSVDPRTDTPAALSAWRARFHAGPRWTAASSSLADAPVLLNFFAKSIDSATDHSTQVSILDREARLVWRTYELPTAQEILQVLQKI